MIIELLGPPASGKTTLARALATALDTNGFDAQLIVSSRPAEGDSIEVENTRALSSRIFAFTAPLSRAAKLTNALPLLFAGSRRDELATSLMELLPPRTVLRSVRLRRLLSSLSRSWQSASISHRIVIFDQGFLTALCSMALLAGSVDRSSLLRGLALIPRPNLLIQLDASRELLESRLHSRLGRQGPIERWFEFDLKTSLQQIELTNEVADIFRKNGGRMMHVSSLDRRMLEKEVDRIVQRVKSWDEEVDLADRSPVERRPLVGVAK
jgi:thymidylate kinase